MFFFHQETRFHIHSTPFTTPKPQYQTKIQPSSTPNPKSQFENPFSNTQNHKFKNEIPYLDTMKTKFQTGNKYHFHIERRYFSKKYGISVLNESLNENR